PGMRVRGRGGVLNVASLGSYAPGPYQAVYYASKAYVLSLTEALHHELRPHGVRVTALCPGPVPTDFQARAGASSSASSARRRVGTAARWS
ncbi:MAG: SDR family NAD(P)-dependent oxidoreductase, partial [Planctomycetes bacterium]|nr:SDR family NAD(P)-dependent oxidoreductase [Planctomycetota bacterium]